MSAISSSSGFSVETPSNPKPSWMHLPPELRIMILKEIAHEKSPGWASCASVCREWQYILEEENYNKLKLQVPCLDDLNEMIPPHKRHLVNHIWFQVQLPRYPAACCARWNPPPAKASSIVEKAIRKLFAALSSWQANRLTLELNVVSPSDSEHWFKPLYFSDDRTKGDEGAAGPRHDPRHGWAHGRRVTAAPKVAMRRMFRSIELDFSRRPLRRVSCVTSFIIRRQLRRCISPLGLSAMLEKLPLLESMCYEPWAPRESKSLASIKSNIRDLSHAIRQQLSQTVASLVVFEDSCKFYRILPQNPAIAHQLNHHKSIAIGEKLGDTFAKRSRRLKNLAVSFMVDAKDILRQCKSSWKWRQLETVALTSQLLRESSNSHRKIERLLCKAAVLAKQMPELDTFVLWNGGMGNACAFIYRVVRDEASITWRGTWRLEMSRSVIEAWKSVASIRTCRGLEIRQERIESTITCVGEAIHHLKLPCQVADPASLWQMRREGNLVP
ncbi:hypothetical protein V8C42DRAFT_363818 [Trichoderma barbatum]